MIENGDGKNDRPLKSMEGTGRRAEDEGRMWKEKKTRPGLKGDTSMGWREARRKQVESGWREQLREGKSGDGGGTHALLIPRRLRSTCSPWPSP